MLRASVLIAALALASPAQAQILRVGMQGDPATLDPAQSAAFVDRVALAAVCDKLIELDAKLNYVPQLAPVSPDRVGRAGSHCVRPVRTLLGRKRDHDSARRLSADPGRHGAALQSARGHVPVERARRAERFGNRARGCTAEALRKPVDRL